MEHDAAVGATHAAASRVPSGTSGLVNSNIHPVFPEYIPLRGGMAQEEAGLSIILALVACDPLLDDLCSPEGAHERRSHTRHVRHACQGGRNGGGRLGLRKQTQNILHCAQEERAGSLNGRVGARGG